MTGSICRRVVVQTMGFVLLAEFVLGGLSGASAAELRTWTDQSGQYQIKARLVRVEGDKVVLQRADGTEIRVELAKLNEADQAYARENASAGANPFQRVNPPAGGNSAGPFQPADDRPASPENGMVEIDWSAVQTVAEQPVLRWNFTVAAAVGETPARTKPITLPTCSAYVAWCQAIVNRVCHCALIGYVFDRVPAGRETGLVLCDLQSGRVRSYYGPGRMTPMALSDSGDQMLMLSLDAWRGRGDLVELWSITPSGVQVTSRWHAHAEDERDRLTVRGAAFLPEGKLATFSGAEESQRDGFDQHRPKDASSGAEGQLVVWAMNPPKPLYRITSGNRSYPAVSPDGRYIAFAKNHCVDILDVKAGQIVAAATLPEIDDPVFAFSPSGARLAALGRDKIYVWDFTTGKLDHTIQLMGARSAGWVMWTGEGQVLDGHTLFDVERERKLWEYEDAAGVLFCDGACWFVVPGSPRQPPVLLPLKIPHPEALQRLRDTPIEFGFFVLAPGTTVRVVADAVSDTAQRERIRALLTEKLQANDCKAGEQSSVELAVSVKRDEPTRLYLTNDPFPFPHPFFSPPPNAKTYPFQGYTVGLTFTYRGEAIWQAFCSSAPSGERLKQDETIDQFIRRHEKPNYQWFETVDLPKVLTKSRDIPPLGSSRVSASGLQDGSLPQAPRMFRPGEYRSK